MDRPDELVAHKEFFNTLFDAFDELLFYRVNKPDKYDEKYEEYKSNFLDAHIYYYSKVAKPSPHYNEEVIGEIESNLIKLVE